MEDIKRYDIDLGVWKEEDSNGEWVCYTDHKAIVEEYKEMLIKANEGYCPERLGYKQDYKYNSANCGRIDCSECLRWYLDNGVKDEMQ